MFIVSGHICPLLLFVGQQNLLLPMKAPPNLVASTVIPVIYTEAGLSGVLPRLHVVSPGLAHQAGIFLTCLECPLTWLETLGPGSPFSLGSRSISGGQNSLQSSSGLRGRYSRRTSPNAHIQPLLALYS